MLRLQIAFMKTIQLGCGLYLAWLGFNAVVLGRRPNTVGLLTALPVTTTLIGASVESSKAQAKLNGTYVDPQEIQGAMHPQQTPLPAPSPVPGPPRGKGPPGYGLPSSPANAPAPRRSEWDPSIAPDIPPNDEGQDRRA